jgi:RNA polymerase sigma-70 factor (ECF subfamily)
VPLAARVLKSSPRMTEAESNDHDLMLAVRDGDLAELGRLFERHHRPLYGLFVRTTRQRTASEDLVQQVFYRMLKYRHTYRDDGRFLTWMYHLARKVAADHFRKSRNTPDSLDDTAIAAVPDQAPLARDRAVQNDDLAVMAQAFAQLQSDEREILTLQRFQHLGHEDIARLLDCSIGAAKVRTHRALKALRDKYLRLCRPASAT